MTVYCNVGVQGQGASENAAPDVELTSMVDGWQPLGDEDLEKRISDKIVVAVMGRVSAGKSTLMKALLQIDPKNTDVLQVSALSGTTKSEQAFVWRFQGGEFVLLDFPGFQEVYGEQRAEEANNFKDMMNTFLKYGKIDVGIFVANGVPDMSQKQDYDKLARCEGAWAWSVQAGMTLGRRG